MLGVTGFDIFNLGDDHAHHLVQLIYASLHLILITTGKSFFIVGCRILVEPSLFLS